MAGRYPFERGLQVSELVSSAFGEAAPAPGQLAAELMDEAAVFCDEVAGIDGKAERLFERRREARHHQERRIRLPAEDPRDRRGADAGGAREARYAFEGEGWVVSHHVRDAVDGRPEGLEWGWVLHGTIAARRATGFPTSCSFAQRFPARA